MAVSVVGTPGAFYNGFTSSFTVSVTVPASTEWLFALVRSTSAPTGVTANGDAMTLDSTATNWRLYKLATPDAGTYNVTVAMSGPTAVYGTAISCNSVDPTTPVGGLAFSANGFQGSPASIAVSTPSGGVAVNMGARVGGGGAGTIYFPGGQTTIGTPDAVYGASYAADASAMQCVWDGGAQKSFENAVFYVNPAAGGPPPSSILPIIQRIKRG